MRNIINWAVLVLCCVFIVNCGDDEASEPSEVPLVLTSIEKITSENEEAYPVSGSCEASNGPVTVIIGGPDVEATFECQVDNTFSGSLDVRGVSSHPAQVRLTQGSQSTEEPAVENLMKRFVTRWNFPAAQDFTLPLKDGLNYDFVVDWGDESEASEITSFDDPDKTHTYDSGGEYTITIIGVCEGFQNVRLDSNSMPLNPERDYLIEVVILGNMGWKDLSRAFYGNSNLVGVFGGNTSEVTDMKGIFREAINAAPDTSGWDTSSVTDMNNMFRDTSTANPDTSGWDTSSVIDMGYMFRGAVSVNPDTSQWDTSAVTNMTRMFLGTMYAKPDTINWDTSSVTDMNRMFREARVANPNTANWDTSSVTDMGEMFLDATSADPDTTNWDTSSVTDMSYMFSGAASANPDTRNWDFNNIQGIRDIFNSFTSLSLENYSYFLTSLAATVRSGVQDSAKGIGREGRIAVQYSSEAAADRQELVDDGWNINDGGQEGETVPLELYELVSLTSENEEAYPVSGICDPPSGVVTVIVGEPNVEVTFECQPNNMFSGTLDVSNVSSHPAQVRVTQGSQDAEGPAVDNLIKRFVTRWNFPAAQDFTLPLKDGLNYDFVVDWGDESEASEITSFDDPDKTHTYESGGEYIITIIGLCEGFENVSFDTNSNPVNPERDYLIEVVNLGNMGWRDLSRAFHSNSNLVEVFGGKTSEVTDMSEMFLSAGDATPDTSGWDTSEVTDMSEMFLSAGDATPDTSGWDTSEVTDMSEMFRDATSAEPNTTDWDTSEVTDMSEMFYNATSANPNTTDWDTSGVTDMSRMFYDATSANPNTTDWDTSEVTDMSEMFRGATSAEPSTNGWNTSSVTSMISMFRGATNADPDTGDWNTSSVTSMISMFRDATNATPFMSNWNISSVTNMSFMFRDATSAEPNTTDWDTSSVTSMLGMFDGATSASPNTTNWNTAAVTDMSSMFNGATSANPNTTNWNFSQISSVVDIFNGPTSLSVENYSNFLISLAATVPAGVPSNNKSIGADQSIAVQYNAGAATARQTLVDQGWEINDGGQEPDPEPDDGETP